MDVAWQDSGGVGSFLDSSGTDPSSFASFASGDGSVLWSSAADSPIFSSQSVLWESSADSPGDSHLSGLTLDSASGNDPSTLSLAGWNADATSGLAGSTLSSGLLWAGAGSDTSSTLSSNGGVGLGALDLGAPAAASSQWQQFVDQLAGGSATGLADTPHLLWTGTSSQTQITVPVASGSQTALVAPSDGLPTLTSGSTGAIPTIANVPTAGMPTLGTVSPAQLTWQQPSGASGLTTGPTLTDAGPTPALSGSVAAVVSPSGQPLAGSASLS